MRLFPSSARAPRRCDIALLMFYDIIVRTIFRHYQIAYLARIWFRGKLRSSTTSSWSNRSLYCFSALHGQHTVCAFHSKDRLWNLRFLCARQPLIAPSSAVKVWWLALLRRLGSTQEPRHQFCRQAPTSALRHIGGFSVMRFVDLLNSDLCSPSKRVQNCFHKVFLTGNFCQVFVIHYEINWA